MFTPSAGMRTLNPDEKEGKISNEAFILIILHLKSTELSYFHF